MWTTPPPFHNTCASKIKNLLVIIIKKRWTKTLCQYHTPTSLNTLMYWEILVLWVSQPKDRKRFFIILSNYFNVTAWEEEINWYQERSKLLHNIWFDPPGNKRRYKKFPHNTFSRKRWPLERLLFSKKVTLRETRVFLPTLRDTLEGEKTDP